MLCFLAHVGRWQAEVIVVKSAPPQQHSTTVNIEVNYGLHCWYMYIWKYLSCPQVPVVNYSKGIQRSLVFWFAERNSAALASDLLTAIRPSLQLATKNRQIPWCTMIILLQDLLAITKFFTNFIWITLCICFIWFKITHTHFITAVAATWIYYWNQYSFLVYFVCILLCEIGPLP